MKGDATTTYAKTEVEIFFPGGDVVCELCPLMETYSRKQCRRTGEYLLNTRDTVGIWCPLRRIENEEECL